MITKKHYSRRRVIQVMGGVAGGLLLHACNVPNGSNQTGSGAGEMSFSLAGVRWMGLTPLFIAREKGFFAENNLVVDTFIFDSTNDSKATFIADEVEAAAPISSEAISLAAQGKDFRIVLVEDMSVGGNGILADNTVGDIEDFRGKQVAVERGTVSHFFLLQVLEDFGLSESDITIFNADPSAAAAAYQERNVDIAVTYAPYLSQANQAREGGRVIYDSSKKPTAIADLYAFDTAFINQRPQAVEAFVKGIFKGIEFLEKNREEALLMAAQKLEVRPEELAADLKGILLPDAQMNLEMLTNAESDIYLGRALENLGQFLSKEGQIKETPDTEKLIEPKVVKAVANA